jgi:quercetin dioxygenase-like cupin family protein
MIRAWHLYTGEDGNSHVTRGHISETALIEAKAIHFKETAAHSDLDWHDAPTTQYVITLSGVLEFTNRGGETFIIEPGDILIAMDTTGTGHKWRLINDQPWRRAYIIFPPDTNPQFIPEK